MFLLKETLKILLQPLIAPLCLFKVQGIIKNIKYFAYHIQTIYFIYMQRQANQTCYFLVVKTLYHFLFFLNIIYI